MRRLLILFALLLAGCSFAPDAGVSGSKDGLQLSHWNIDYLDGLGAQVEKFKQELDPDHPQNKYIDPDNLRASLAIKPERLLNETVIYAGACTGIYLTFDGVGKILHNAERQFEMGPPILESCGFYDTVQSLLWNKLVGAHYYHFDAAKTSLKIYGGESELLAAFSYIEDVEIPKRDVLGRLK